MLKKNTRLFYVLLSKKEILYTKIVSHCYKRGSHTASFTPPERTVTWILTFSFGLNFMHSHLHFITHTHYLIRSHPHIICKVLICIGDLFWAFIIVDCYTLAACPGLCLPLDAVGLRLLPVRTTACFCLRYCLVLAIIFAADCTFTA